MCVNDARRHLSLGLTLGADMHHSGFTARGGGVMEEKQGEVEVLEFLEEQTPLSLKVQASQRCLVTIARPSSSSSSSHPV